MDERDLTIRAATPADADALRRLAELDSARPLTGVVLVAEVGGAPLAAVALGSGAAISDPFEPSAGAVEALRLRRYQILRQDGGQAPAWSVLRRLVPRRAI